MPAIRTKLNPRSDAFKANAERMSGLVADLRAQVAKAAQGGDERRGLASGPGSPVRGPRSVEPGRGAARADRSGQRRCERRIGHRQPDQLAAVVVEQPVQLVR